MRACLSEGLRSEPEGFEPPKVEVPVEPLFPPRPLPPLGPTPAIVVALPESGCAEEAHCGRSLVLAVQDRLPVVFAGHGIDVFLAQEADFVGLHQCVRVGRIGMEFAVIELDGAAILHAAMEGLHFAVALDGLGDAGRGNRQRDDEQREKEDGRKQNVALL